MNTQPHDHDDPNAIPEFLCRICHPEFTMTPELRRALDAADAERRARERAESARHREINKAQARLEGILKRGEPEPGLVASKIAAALRRKLDRLQTEEQPMTKAKTRIKTKANPPAARPQELRSTKQSRLIDMLKSRDGVTIEEIGKALHWQPHTVRGAIAGSLKKRLGLDVRSENIQGRGRVYRIAA